MKVMKKFSKLVYILAALPLVLASCHKDTELNPTSIFTGEEPTVQNDFDRWILKNYTTPYNIEVKYRLEDKETDHKYNLAPAEYEKAIALAKLTRFLWLESYEELKGDAFIRTYCPKILNFIGSVAYQSGAVVLGTAEGGMKITLYNVNSLDIENPDIEFLNYWYFKTMHHEFAHILHQTKNYPTDFNEISLDYQSGSWVNLSDREALGMGFISNYASSEPQEDFVELISIYVTHDAAYWNAQLKLAETDEEGNPTDGREKIEAKFDIVTEYLATSWGIDINALRDIVQRRSALIGGLDLKSLN